MSHPWVYSDATEMNTIIKTLEVAALSDALAKRVKESRLRLGQIA